jgi:plasmid replication initiation protein
VPHAESGKMRAIILFYKCLRITLPMVTRSFSLGQIIRLTVYDLMVSTNRSIGIRGYELLRHAFERLRGVSIVTNIAAGGVEIEHGFGLIEWWKIVKRSPTDSRMVGVELKLSDWLYNAVKNLEMLTLNRDYFRLDGGIERRVYELCRKHCGNQPSWSISLG